MMARSTTRSNQRPDTLMQDRSPPTRRRSLATHGRTIHSGHVWTAPWQELSDVAAALVGCGHVSGLLMRREVAAGPNALRGSGPNRSHAFGSAMTLAGSPDPRNDRICITSSCPRQFVGASAGVGYAAQGSNLGSLKRSPRTIMAQAIRAILLASATAATLIGRRPHKASKPRPFCAVLSRISDDSHSAGDE